MPDILADLARWHAEGTPFAIATVVSTSGSAPRPPGAAMAVAADGTVVGSVSGGCVEGAVYELCREALRTGETVRQVFGYSDSDAFAVGLTCGGAIEVLVTPDPGPALAAGLDAAARGEAVALVHAMEPGGGISAVWPAAGPHGERGRVLGDADPRVVAEARAMLDQGVTGIREICADTTGVTRAFFVESHLPAPRMLVFGAIDFAAAVAGIGRFLGYHVTVCDARPVFATARRFPDAGEVVVDWPHRYLAAEAAGNRVDHRTVICVLTHDAKFDVPLLEVALRLPVAYVGAMGSRRTHEDRLARLREAGLTEGELARLRSPIGLDLGGRTPEETAVAVAAEIVATRRGGTALPLRQTYGPIHHDRSLGRV
ncbi:XdhC family protein [Bailinhaonella thermotolerans]|uniref:XdhC family protein n=1 Tax=Bailinhaonella thermotolerans TaxID=1070861 RepID=A0A3A4AC39_9ACTN|nr:XdhC family protein [Bailinhaonella thermotolerans]RJL23590.1 XdhC family protein [Bailinhaonella thermotolerans]